MKPHEIRLRLVPVLRHVVGPTGTYKSGDQSAPLPVDLQQKLDGVTRDDVDEFLSDVRQYLHAQLPKAAVSKAASKEKTPPAK